jgi:hypothetical protein
MHLIIVIKSLTLRSFSNMVHRRRWLIIVERKMLSYSLHGLIGSFTLFKFKGSNYMGIAGEPRSMSQFWTWQIIIIASTFSLEKKKQLPFRPAIKIGQKSGINGKLLVCKPQVYPYLIIASVLFRNLCRAKVLTINIY